MLSSHLILGCPLLLLPPIPPNIRVFSNESTLHMRWPKYWSFSFSIIPSKEIPGLISFRIDWLDLLAVQGTLKSPNTTVQKYQFFSAQPSSQSNSNITEIFCSVQKYFTQKWNASFFKYKNQKLCMHVWGLLPALFPLVWGVFLFS